MKEQEGVRPDRGPHATRWPWPAAILLLLSLLLLVGGRGAIGRWLEEATGETALRQQLEALVLRLRQPPVATADLAPVAHAGLSPYGANVFFEQEVEEEKIRRSMEMLREAGVRWVRQEFPWERIEIPTKGQYRDPFGGLSWASYDRIVRLAQEYGLEIVARPDLPPGWARTDRSLIRGPPDRLEDYGDFLSALASRYRGQIRYYQIWNEPNLALEWGCPPDAAAYAKMLGIARGRIVAVDPAAIILSAPLAQTLGTPDGCNVSDLDYLEALYRAGAARSFDILSANAHGLFTGTGDRRADRTQTNISRLLLVREIMVRHGDEGKAIWVAEAGWNALPLNYPDAAAHGRVTEEQQARYTVALYERAQEEWPWVGVLFYWFFRRPQEQDRELEDYYYRLAEVDFTPLPVFEAYRSLTSQPPALGIGYHQESHWALQWGEGWAPPAISREASLGGYRPSGVAGAQLTLRFRGTNLTLVTRRWPEAPALRVIVDGEPTGGFPVELKAASEEWQAQVPLVRGLAPGLHTVLVEAQGSGVIVDAWIVERHLRPFLLRRALGALLLAALAGWSLTWVWRRRRPTAQEASGPPL